MKQNKENLYVGDIEIIFNVNKVLLKEIKKLGLNSYDIAITTMPAKTEVTLLKVNDDLYIDYYNSDMDYINYCLENNITKNNNNFLSEKINDPYPGQLILKNVKKKEIVKELKLTNK